MSVKGFICQQNKNGNHNHTTANHLLHAIPAIHHEHLNYLISEDLENRYHCTTTLHQRRPNYLDTKNQQQQQIDPINLVTTDATSYTRNSGSSSQSMCTSSDEVRPSSSSSVDVENDGSMSPASISLNNDKLNDSSLYYKLPYDLTAANQENLTTAAAAAAYQLSFTNLYANGAVFYGSPAIFSPHHQAMATHANAIRPPHLSYMDVLSTIKPTAVPPSCDTSLFSAAYLQTMQNSVAAVGLFDASNPHKQQQQQQQQEQTAHVTTMTESTTLSSCKLNQQLTQQQQQQQRNPSNGSFSALAPSGPQMLSNGSRMSNGEHRRKSQKQQRLISDTPLCSVAHAAHTKLTSTTTYLNDKVNSAVTDASSYFKVPSGKEGSLKHRILTRPLNLEKTESSKIASMRTHNSTSNFKKGSYIELSNGVLRRVEDMRTEDFIQCADRSPYLQLAESTIVKICVKLPPTVVITFSYDKNSSKADIDVSADHPFFVYGQGWASCNPEMSLKVFGLKCQRLQVGDICISLTKRDLAKTTNNNISTGVPAGKANAASKSLTTNQQDKYRNDQSASLHYKHTEMPLNYLKHVPTTLTNHLSVSITPLAATQYNAASMHLNPTNNMSAQNQYVDIAEMVAAYTSGGPITRDHSTIADTTGYVTNPALLPPKLLENFYRQSQPLLHTSNQQSILTSRSTTSMHNAYDAPILSIKENHHNANMDIFLKNDSNGQNESISSRKRRWSTPESSYDEIDECQPQRKSIDITENSNYINFFASTTPSEGNSNGSSS